jgi:cysteine desulfurase
MKTVYLDNNATTRVAPDVVDAMLPYFTEHFGNASSAHGDGATGREAVKVARRSVQRLVGAEFDHEIVFTSGGTEADNTAILSALETEKGRDEIVTTTVEHPAVLALCKHLIDTRGVKVHLVPVDARGRLDVGAFRAAVGPRTAIASVMWANNETGTIFPVPELAAIAHDAGALFHTDAVQAAGRVAIDVRQAGVDLLSLSAHKFHGPKGVGALYVRKGVRLAPLLRGGKQERTRRAGTENVPGIVGMGKAADLAVGGLEDYATRVRGLRDRLEWGLLEVAPGAAVAGDPDHRLPNTTNVAFEYIESEAILTRLDRVGIAASSGSACASGSVEPSHVLRAMKVPHTAIHGAVRFSLSRATDVADVDHVLRLFPGILAELREPSPQSRSLRHAS